MIESHSLLFWIFRQIDRAKWKWQKEILVSGNTFLDAFAAASSKSIMWDVGVKSSPTCADACFSALNRIVYPSIVRFSIAAKQTGFIPSLHISYDLKRNQILHTRLRWPTMNRICLTKMTRCCFKCPVWMDCWTWTCNVHVTNMIRKLLRQRWMYVNPWKKLFSILSKASIDFFRDDEEVMI